jgi:hypothetical protein
MIVTTSLATVYPFAVAWIVIASSIAWKRRQVFSGGKSWLAKNMKSKELHKKKRHRRRLRDFLEDELLRGQMIKEFDEKMGKEECARHMEELQQIASRDVTKDDVQVSTNEVLGAAMRWICLIFTLVAGSVVAALGECDVLLDFLVALGLHVADNKLAVARRCSVFMNLAWFSVWMLLQLLVSYSHVTKFEIPRGLLMVGYLVAVFFACIESISCGAQDSAWGMRPRHEKSIMEV